MTLEVLIEPTGRAYRELIDLALARCASFTLIWRGNQYREDDYALRLAHHLRSDHRVTSWPGTQLLGGPPATMRRYDLNPFSASVLKEMPRLYAWQHPEFPEDLTFYTAAGGVWLGSIAHEAQAWFEDDSLGEDDRNAVQAVLSVARRR